LVLAAAEYFARDGAEITHIGFVEENIHFALPPEMASIP
jgi:hypothetical protein